MVLVVESVKLFVADAIAFPTSVRVDRPAAATRPEGAVEDRDRSRPATGAGIPGAAVIADDR